MIRVLDSADSTLVEWGRQQQQHECDYHSNVNDTDCDDYRDEYTCGDDKGDYYDVEIDDVTYYHV